jgi:hypothetical protein
VLCLLAATALAAEPLKIATWNVGLDRKGPGLLVRDIVSGKAPQVEAVLRVLAALDADVVLLTSVDYDRGLVAGDLLADRLGTLGAPYRYRFAVRPNTGRPTGLDLDGDGLTGGPDDAQGWGLFSGQGGMLILSRLPVDAAGVRDFSDLLWVDLPGALLPDLSDAARRVQRLSTTGHWEVPLILSDGGRLRLLVWHATPPVFDGPEDRNGRRNHDETAFWLALLDGRLPLTPPVAPFVLMGDANLDPSDGDGRPEALQMLLAHPMLQDPAPRGATDRRDAGQVGDAALDTAFYDSLGGLRLDYILPSAGLPVTAAGVLWPGKTDPLAADLAAASSHFPVWIVLDPLVAATPPP